MAQSGTPQDTSYSGHVLPAYFEKIQRYLVLPLLLLAEFYVNGLLAARGFVNDLSQPKTWSWYGGIGVGIMFFALGLACAGIALGLSGRCAEAFANGRWYGILLLLGVILFAGIEFYAGISERSVNLIATPADMSLGQALAMPLQAATPASVLASLILPAATIFYGFALKPPRIESVAERQRRHEMKLAEARYKAELHSIQAGGLGAMAHNVGKSLLGGNSANNQGDNAAITGGISGSDDDGSGAHMGMVNGAGDGAITSGLSGASRGKGSRTATVQGIPANKMDKHMLVAYMWEHHRKVIDPEDALLLIQHTTGHERLEGVKGNPYVAPKKVLIQRAKEQWLSGSDDASAAS